MQRWQPSHRPSANFLTLVSAGTRSEYIAAGDSEAAVPFTTKKWKSLSYLLLQLGSNGGETSLPEKVATEATFYP